jgi:hypothetical protein
MDIGSTDVSGCGQRVPKVLARPRQHCGTRNNNEVRVQRLRDDSLPLLWMSLLRARQANQALLTSICLKADADALPLAFEPQHFDHLAG